MTPEQFNVLSSSEKSLRLYRNGVFIGKKKLCDEVSVLWQYDGFYVEVFYSRYRLNVQRMKCYAAVDIVFEYLSSPDLQALLVYT